MHSGYNSPLWSPLKITLENNLDIKIVENRDEIFKNNASFLNSGYLPIISSNAGINKSEQNIEIETPNNLSGKLDNMKSENSFSNISLLNQNQHSNCMI